MDNNIRQITYDGVGGLKECNENTLPQLKYNGALYHLHIKNRKAIALTSKRISKKDGLLNNKIENFPELKKEKFPFKKETIIVVEVVAEHLGIPQGTICNFVAGIMNSKPETLKINFPDGNPLKMIAHDILYYEGKDTREMPYYEKLNILTDCFPDAGDYGEKIDYNTYNAFIVYSISNLFIYKNKTFDDWIDFVNDKEFIYEGVVLKDYYTGDSIKILKEKTCDCIILGATEGNGKYSDMIGSLIVGVFVDKKEIPKKMLLKNKLTPKDVSKLVNTDKIVTIANISGFDDYLRYDITSNLHKKYIGKVVEVSYKVKAKNKLFHPRFRMFREDKQIKRCVMAQFDDVA